MPPKPISVLALFPLLLLSACPGPPQVSPDAGPDGESVSATLSSAGFVGALGPGQEVVFQYQAASGELLRIAAPPDPTLTAVARQAVDMAPRWLRPDLQRALARVDGQLQLSLWVPQQILDGHNPLPSLGFSQTLGTGAVDLYLVDRNEYQRRARGEAFMARQAFEGATRIDGQSIPLGEGDWYLVLSNARRLVHTQWVELELRAAR